MFSNVEHFKKGNISEMFPQLIQGLSEMKQVRIIPLQTFFEVQILQLLFKMKLPHRTKKSRGSVVVEAVQWTNW